MTSPDAFPSRVAKISAWLEKMVSIRLSTQAKSRATRGTTPKRLFIQFGHMHRRIWRVWVPDGLHVWWKNRGVHIFWSERPHVEFDRVEKGSDGG